MKTKNKRKLLEKFVASGKTVDEFLTKERLELNRWIVDDSIPEWVLFYTKKDMFGFDANGNWIRMPFQNNPNEFPTNHYATKKEIVEKLTKEAIKRGFVGKKYFLDSDGNFYMGDFYLLMSNDGTWSEAKCKTCGK